jgi:hypothetical protein
VCPPAPLPSWILTKDIKVGQQLVQRGCSSKLHSGQEVRFLNVDGNASMHCLYFDARRAPLDDATFENTELNLHYELKSLIKQIPFGLLLSAKESGYVEKIFVVKVTQICASTASRDELREKAYYLQKFNEEHTHVSDLPS